MGNIGDSVTQPIPVVGTLGTGYATQVNAFLTEAKARLEARLPISSILMGEFNLTNNPVVGASSVGLTSATAIPATPLLSLQTFGGDLYWVSPSGAVKITSGVSLNAAALNGITGDYGGVNPAQFRFVDADKTFYAYDDFTLGEYAHLDGLTLNVRGGVSSAVRARIAWAGTTNMTVTLPPALPATTKLLQMGSTGTITADNALPVDTNITLSGTGHISHTTRNITTTMTVGVAGTFSQGITNLEPVIQTTSGIIMVPIPGQQQYDKLEKVRIRYTTSANDFVPIIYLCDGASTLPSNQTPVAPTSLVFTTAGSFRFMTLTLPLLAGNNIDQYWTISLNNSAASTLTFYSITATYAA